MLPRTPTCSRDPSPPSGTKMCSPTHSAGTLRITGNAGMNYLPRFSDFSMSLNHTGTPRVPSDALPPPARVPSTHRSLHSAALALTVRVCGACHALLLRQCPGGTCTHPRRCVECTPRAGAARAHLRPPAGSILGTWSLDLRSCENHTSSTAARVPSLWAQPGYCSRIIKTRRNNGGVRLEQ